MKKMVSYSSLLIIFLVFLVVITTNSADTLFPSYYEKGNKYYKEGDFTSALQAYKTALEQREVFSQKYPWIYFKVGYCNFRIQQYDKALEIFERGLPRLKSIEDYIIYFSLLSKLQQGRTSDVLEGLNSFLKQFPGSPLVPFADSLCADLYFTEKNWARSALFYKKLLDYPYFDRGEIYARLIRIAVERKHFNEVRKYGYTMLQKYPFHTRSDYAYKEIIKVLGSKHRENDFMKLYKYLVRTQQFKKAERLVRFQERSSGRSELTRWLAIELLYKKSHYQQALDACFAKRKSFTSIKYRREIDLTIARCYLRLGETKKSINAYVKFQKLYPGDYLAPEVLWKIAWLYEDLRNQLMARHYYQKLIATYPRNKFISEARFRIGLIHYRENQFDAARQEWARSAALERSDYRRARFRYWVAKTYLKQQKFEQYLKELATLAENPFRSYYNLKSFLLLEDSSPVHQRVDSLLWEMHHNRVSYLGDNMEKLQRPLLIQDILGDMYARYELDSDQRKWKNSGWQSHFALAELHEKLGNYGKAFRLYRRIFDRQFSNKEWSEWLFMFKRLYPLYYNETVNYFAENQNLTPAIVWAIIKKESAFKAEVVSVADAYGLMQIIPPTARQISRELGLEMDDVNMLFKPEFNINLGTYYISELLKRYHWNLYYALAAYNAGPHRVDRWQKNVVTMDDDFFMENIEFSETRGYVRTVMKYYWTYYLLLHPQRVPEDVFSFPQKLVREPWYKEIQIN